MLSVKAPAQRLGKSVKMSKEIISRIQNSEFRRQELKGVQSHEARPECGLERAD
jgi:hypothetical protein